MVLNLPVTLFCHWLELQELEINSEIIKADNSCHLLEERKTQTNEEILKVEANVLGSLFDIMYAHIYF